MKDRVAGLIKVWRVGVLLLFLSCCYHFVFSQQTEYDLAVIDYVMTYNEIAVKEMKIYKIPASITLAQGIFESNAGRSRLAKEGNNHFGIKCHKDWTGDTIREDDETPGECFRKYGSAEESFRDHSWFLSKRDRYKPLFLLDIRDYKGWAHGLKAAGYATNPQYPEKLIKTIEKYQLYRYDSPEYVTILPEPSAPVSDSMIPERREMHFPELAAGPGGHMIYLNNGVRLIISQAGDTWKTISLLFGIPEKKLYRFNDLRKGARMVPGQLVYLDKKRRNGETGFHTVQSGETMFTIAQLNGIRLKRLYNLNEISSGDALKPGQKLFLR